MSVALAKTTERAERPTLSEEKGRELLGLVLLALALFFAISFASFDPRDPSVLHRTVSSGGRARNLIGPVGAHTAAVAFGFFGIACLAIPCLLLVSGVRRLRKQVAERVVGRGIGTGLLLVALPGLLDLTLGNFAWPRGGLVQSGGAFGHLLAAFLDARLSFAGSALLLGFAVLIGTALAGPGLKVIEWSERLPFDGHPRGRERPSSPPEMPVARQLLHSGEGGTPCTSTRSISSSSVPRSCSRSGRAGARGRRLKSTPRCRACGA